MLGGSTHVTDSGLLPSFPTQTPMRTERPTTQGTLSSGLWRAVPTPPTESWLSSTPAVNGTCGTAHLCSDQAGDKSLLRGADEAGRVSE